MLTHSAIPIARNFAKECNPKSAILTPIRFRGLSAWITGWAGDEAGTVYASLIGRQTPLTALWAAFQDNETLKFSKDAALQKRRAPEQARYHSLRARLPETGWQHLVLLHTQATVNNLPDEDFYLLAETSAPPLDRFWAQWNNALPLPALPEWVDTLWHEGMATGLIIPCPAEGIHCWRVRVDPDAWGGILQQIVLDSN